MNIKKLIATGAGAALLLSTTAIPALAFGGHHWWNNDGDLNLNIDNDARVTNNVDTTANTGFNAIGGEGGFNYSINGGGNHDFDGVIGGLIDTGNATAVSGVANDVNTNIVDLCNCLGDFDDVDIHIDNDAHVTNNVDTTANTGFNAIGGFAFEVAIDTGSAGSQSVVANTVNTNIVGDAL